MNRLRIFFLALLLSFSFDILPMLGTSLAKWIYYPGDFEIWLTKNIALRRTERNQPYPPMWRVDPAYGTVVFSKRISLMKPEKASIAVDGKYFIRGLNNAIMYEYNPKSFTLPAGNYKLSVFVENYQTVPSILFESESYPSNSSWSASSFNDDHVEASEYNSSSPTQPPSSFRLKTVPQECKLIEETVDYRLYDFGKNSFGYPLLKGVNGNGKILLCYGESKDEAMAGKLAETWDELDVNHLSVRNDTLATKAFRFVKIVKSGTALYNDFSLLYEFLPVTYRGSFSCSDDTINQIYQTALYTLHLTTRECHIDGIKRDRWVWSGDALQSYMMNFYTFFDEDVNKRTLWGLRGHSPVNKDVNTIVDYSFYWMIGVDYQYQYTGDTTFVKQIYPRMKETMEFCLNRLNKNGMAQGKEGDWTFVDWAPIDKKGEISFIQLLFIKSLMAMKNSATLAGDEPMARRMQELYVCNLKQFDSTFWSPDKKAFLHNRLNGRLSQAVTRYTNVFAILYNLVDDERKAEIKQSVLLNDSIPDITTPYMKFYELAALCEMGEQAKVLDFVKSYWGGMLKLRATTFWETYDPKLPADKHYEMYRRPFGKSLCHAWGANPVYLFGRYFLGVYPIASGYKEYIVEPNLGGLKNMKGVVPTPHGDVSVAMDSKQIVITTGGSVGGMLKFRSKTKPVCKQGLIEKIGLDQYNIRLEKTNTRYEVRYKQ
ncbi:MAG: alpha-rhamnosidase [Bacteroidales bacterium]|nr:alpha-rhamnosidase [Bacteroidales bacterium]